MTNQLTVKTVLEITETEAVVLEGYLDNSNVPTAFIGMTNYSGHEVWPRYKDNPQTLDRAVQLSMWSMQRNYVPAVNRAFGGQELPENVFAGGASFHWNTGAIERASWVPAWLAGDMAEAERRLMLWVKSRGRVVPGLVKRRRMEADLIFRGVWAHRATASLVPVSKPSYKPNFRAAEQVDIKPVVERMIPSIVGGEPAPEPEPEDLTPDEIARALAQATEQQIVEAWKQRGHGVALHLTREL